MNKAAANRYLEQLPVYSHWPEILLGLRKFRKQKRDSKENQREYNKDKWGLALKSYLKRTQRNHFSDLLQEEFGENKRQIVFYKGKLEKMGARRAFELHVNLIADVVGQHLPAPGLVELGAGTGRVLFSIAQLLGKTCGELIAGELALNGRRFIKAVAANSGIQLRTIDCDFTRATMLKGSIPTNSIIYTSMAIVCVPRLGNRFLQQILIQKPKLVVHCEPTYEFLSNDSLLGLLQKRYIQINKYNINLASFLQKAEQKGMIKVIKKTPPILGSNPLLPSSIIAWKPI